jgi:D-alanyl-D-alanine carboxypeptidase/D-alanyl-D-alanine-endopeptidase (penicillin-binding protein 4)
MRPDRPRNPASNQKLLTAAAALWRLGPSFTASTRVEGTIQPDGTVSKLVVRPSGDPSLGYARLVALAQSTRLRGVDRVERVVIDDRYFDDRILPPAFEQQPHEAAAFRAAISAFAVNRNSYVVHLGPGPRVGTPARVRVLSEDYVQIDNRTTTTAAGPPAPRIDDQVTPQGHLSVVVEGVIPQQVGTLYYRRRVPDPKAYAAGLLAQALRQAGIGGALVVGYGRAEETQPLIGQMSSAPLSTLLYALGKWSDNFTAEMILKIMGAEAERPGTSARGVAVVLDELRSRGIDTDALVMVNGSGLFDGNRVTPRHLTQTLVAAYRDPAISAEYVSMLAVAGSDGTLQSRLQDLPRPRMVRAKTGTLRDAIALSGYVLGDRERSVAFSFLANGIAGKQRLARDLADDIVRALAAYVTDDAR